METLYDHRNPELLASIYRRAEQSPPADVEPVVNAFRVHRGRLKRGEVASRFERELRQSGIAYVNIDDAKRALFSNAKLRSFHFVVYSKSAGPNWLVMARQGAQNDQACIDDMRGWEGIFGDGFRAMFVWIGKDDQFRFAALSGSDRPSLDDLI